MEQPITILCLASNYKGDEFLRECKRLGCRVFLLIREDERDAPWPREAVDEVFHMPSLQLNRQEVIHGVSYLARQNRIDRIVALDDLDVEVVAGLREHLRIPGMGETTARYFRDKLAMRVRAREAEILVPDFCRVLNYQEMSEWMEHVPPPWVLKPRSEASSVGIRKIHHAEELWRALDTLGDRQSYYVLEKYIAGTVYHVDSIISEREVLFAEVHKYARPPLDVMHGGGIFCSRTVPRGSDDERRIHVLNQMLVRELGLLRGVTHTEFIKGQADDQFYFLETASRVGGAFIAEMVEGATGVNLWREWARLEVAHLRKEPYSLPPRREEYAGIVMSLSRQEWPDMSAYTDPEIVYRIPKRHHAGLIVASQEVERVETLLDEYMRRFAEEFVAALPAPDTLVE
jgi:biotin carboxylase